MRAPRLRQPAVYLLASKRNGVLYCGVTSGLFARVGVHKQNLIDGLTRKHGVHCLVYYELHETMDAAILRETRIKKWRRAWKVRLIEQMNPGWRHLSDERLGEIMDGSADRERLRC